MADEGTLTWDAAPGAIEYLVQYKLSTSSTFITAPGTNPTTSTSFTITNLESGKTYNFRVSSECTTGEGVAEQTATTPCIDVSGLSSVFLSNGDASITWNRIPEAASYIIEYKLQSSGTYINATGSPLSNPGSGITVNFILDGLTGGNTYDFRVRTNCTVGTSIGVTTSATASCPAVPNLEVNFS